MLVNLPQHFRVTALCLLALAFTSLGHAEQPTTIPTSPEQQLEIFHALSEKSRFSVYETDEQGNLIFVGFCNRHGRHASTPPEQQVTHRDERPGLDDDDFRRILHFPKLRAVATQFQRISDDGYAVLTAFPDLVAVNLSNLKTALKRDTTQQAPTSQTLLYLDQLRRLQDWNTTHSFGYQDEPAVLNKMQGFPELRSLNVDVGHADDFDELFPFILQSPKLEFLKLHRTNFSEAQVKQILDALPNLKRLDIKPRGNTPGKRWSYRSLRMIQDYPNLESLRLIHADALPLPWEDGLEHLVAAKDLKYLDFPMSGDGREVRPEDLQRLQQSRPDLKILPLMERDEARRTKEEMRIQPTKFDTRIGPA